MTTSIAASPRASGSRLRPNVDFPLITVVVASNRERKLLDSCLASLMPQCNQFVAELIVVRAGTAAEIMDLRASYPDVRFIAAAPATAIPQLRGIGMAESTGDIVALTEDHCVVDPSWVATLLQNADGADVIGGSMDNAQRDRAVDWAAYFAEYGFFAEPRSGNGNRGGPLLTGANVAYKRRVVRDVAEWARHGEWENVAHRRLWAHGSAMRFVRSAAVYQNRNYRFREFCVDRYEHGRDYARTRLAEEGSSRRWILFVASPLLPSLLVWRVARAAAPKRWGAFCRALPATFAFLCAWSVGEAVGYLRGPRPATDNYSTS